MFKKLGSRRDEKLRREFLPEALEIIEKPASPLGHALIWIIIAAVISFLIWAAIGRVDENATAQGKIVTEMGVQTVQSEVNGSVKQIFVKEGDKVKKGDALLLLDTSLDESTYSFYENAESCAKLKIKLLKKLLKGEEISILSLSDPTEQEKDVFSYVDSIREEKENELNDFDNQVSLSKSSLETERKNLSILQVQLENLQKKKSLYQKKMKRTTSYDEQLAVLENKLKRLNKKYKKYEQLFQEELITKPELEQISDNIEETKGDIEIQKKNVENQKSEMKDSLAEVKSEISEMIVRMDVQKAVVAEKEQSLKRSKKGREGILSKYDAKVKSLIVEQQDVRNQAEMNKKQYEKQLESSTIASPCDGVVQIMAVNTEGAVVTASTALVQIIPDNSELIMEASVNNSDIGYIKLNQEVKIKLSTYDYQEFGLLKGKVNFISKDSQQQENGGEVYRIKVSIDAKKYLEENPSIELKTGMQGTVEVKTGSRRVIDFFLEPLTKHFDESLTVR